MNKSKYNYTCTFVLLHNLYLSPGLKGEIPKFGEVDFQRFLFQVPLHCTAVGHMIVQNTLRHYIHLFNIHVVFYYSLEQNWKW